MAQLARLCMLPLLLLGLFVCAHGVSTVLEIVEVWRTGSSLPWAPPDTMPESIAQVVREQVGVKPSFHDYTK